MRDESVPHWTWLSSQFYELASYSLLSVGCFFATWLLFGSMAFEGYALAALLLCYFSCVTPSLSSLILLGKSNAVQSDFLILFTMGFRFLMLLGGVALSAATKWQHHNSFCNCLLGYYFPFLLLQSALLIRSQSLPHPPQS